MTEKTAAELIKKFQEVPTLKDWGGMDFQIAKECALIAVNEIMNAILSIEVKGIGLPEEYINWCAVKDEIEKAKQQTPNNKQ